MTLLLTTRTGVGRALTWAEGDANWSAIETAVNGLLAASPGVGIASITQPTPATIQITLSDSTIATFTLPVGSYTFRGTWAVATSYVVNDTFQQNGSLYAVLLAHTSASSFDPAANDGSGHNYYQLLLSAPSNALPTGGTTGQALIKTSGTDFATGWGSIALGIISGLGSGVATALALAANATGGFLTAIPARVSSALSAATGTVSLDPTTRDIATVTPTGDMTVNASTTPAKRLTFIVTTSGTASYNVTFGTNFKSSGVIATGTTTAKVWTVTFEGDGTTFTETARTGPL
jgi:hypothetical protein